MKHTDVIYSDYHGALHFVEENKDISLRVFVVDDDLFFLNLLKLQLTKNSKVEVFTFLTGEKCLNNLHLNPDLIILDYHLDGQQRNSKNGSVIANKIKEVLPNTEIIIISSDPKLSSNKKLRRLKKTSVYYKDDYINEKIKSKYNTILKRRKNALIQQTIFPSLVILFLLSCLIIYLNF